MRNLSISVDWKGQTLTALLDQSYCLAIPLDHTHPQPNAYGAPLFEAEPHKVDQWIGDTRTGASVNFYDLRINPHGNGTHTECVGHISKERYSVHDSLGTGFFLAQLISVYPTQMENGDRVIDQLEWEDEIEALILRTLPNYPDKMVRHYTGTNPPYLHHDIADRMMKRNIQHLLLDLPSVDREEDGGALLAHKTFWQYPEFPRLEATITEMIYVDNVIADGLYLLEIQMPAIELDASPSRPYIYPLK
jgi:arylformamidase